MNLSLVSFFTIQKTIASVCTPGEDYEECIQAVKGPSLETNFTEIANFIGLPTSLQTIGGILGKLTPWLFTFAGIALFIYLIIGGFSYLTSTGDPKKVEGAQGKITAALIGFIIVFVAFWIVQIAAYIFGLESLKIIFGII